MEERFMKLYRWIDTIPLSRPKRNIARDFSDGVLMSEVVHHFFPKMVDLHHYAKTNSVEKKKYNWKHLNKKVFKEMGFSIPETDIIAICNCARGAIEETLELVQHELAAYQERLKAQSPTEKKKKIYSFHKPTESSAIRRSESTESVGDGGNFFDPLSFANRSARARSVPATPRSSRTPNRSGRATPKDGRRSGRSRGPKDRRSQTQTHSRQMSRDASPGRSSARSLGKGKLLKKDEVIKDLNNTITILQSKISRLETLLKLKDQHIENLQTKLGETGED